MFLFLLFNLNLPFVIYSLIALVVTALLLILYARWNYGFLEKLGIPVEPPTFVLGSCPDVYKKYPPLEDIRRFRKYGTIFGVYEGRSPQILIADPELVKLIMVRDYDHFHSRAPIDLGHSISNEILDYLPHDKWKAVRSMLSPQLSSSKLKSLFVFANDLSREFVEDLANDCKGERIKVDFRNRIVAVLIDLAASGLYGIELENRKDPENAFVQMIKHVLCEDVEYDWRYVMMQVFPFMKYIFPGWPFPNDGVEMFRRIMVGYLRKRRQDKDEEGNIVRKNDLGDVYVDMMNRVETPEFQKLGITENTAMSQVLELFFTSYDSTGTSATMCLYYLSQNPEMQDKVIAEVDEVFKYDGELALESLGDLTYLTACINEALRLNPPFIRPERQCTKDWIGRGDFGFKIKIPKGANVLIPIWAMHRHPDYFPDPDTFNPDRFMPENIKKIHQYAFAPFGHGPKNCIGMKLAYNNIKTILAHVFRNFRVEARADTQLEYKRGRLFVFQYEPIFFDFVKRN
jgi:cytochrome P450